MSFYALSFFGRCRPALRSSSQSSGFRGRLCLSPKLTAAITRLTSSRRAALQPQEESVNGTESISDDGITKSISPASKSGILYEVRESTYYHAIMENLPNYQTSIFSRNELQSLLCGNHPDVIQILERQDWTAVSNEELVNYFHILTSYAVANNLSISMPQFDSICSAITSSMPKLSDREFLEIGKLHTLWPFPESVKTKNYKSLYESFDASCCTRYKSEWYPTRQIIKILQASDIFYWQRLGRFSRYLRLIIQHYGKKIKEPHHMIQLMFYLGLLGSAPRSYKFYDLERKIYSFEDQYSLPELTIVVHAFFRLKSRIQYYPLMQNLLEKSLDSVSTLDDTLLITISKGLHFAPEELKPLLKNFQAKLLTRLDSHNTISSVHALWMFASNRVLEQDFGDAVYDKALKEISTLRHKELTRLITVFTEYRSPKRDMKRFAESIVAELQMPGKVNWLHRKSFIQGAVLHRLLICGVYPDVLLDQYLSSVDSVEKSYEALGVDVHLEVFYPNYNKARLRDDLREQIYKYRFEDAEGEFVKSCGKIGKRSTFNLRSVQFAECALLEIVEGKDHFLIKRSIPSFGYLDVIIQISKDGVYLPIPEVMRNIKSWELARIPPECAENGSKFLAITFISNPREFADKNLTSFQNEKKAILEKLGFIYMEVSVSDLRVLPLSDGAALLKEKIAGVLLTD